MCTVPRETVTSLPRDEYIKKKDKAKQNKETESSLMLLIGQTRKQNKKRERKLFAE